MGTGGLTANITLEKYLLFISRILARPNGININSVNMPGYNYAVMLTTFIVFSLRVQRSLFQQRLLFVSPRIQLLP